MKIRKISGILIYIACLFLLISTLSQKPSQASENVSSDVRSFLINLEKAIDEIASYRVMMTSENWKGKRHDKKVMKFQFKRPNLMRVDVLEGRKKGSTVLMNKKGKIRGKNSLGFKMTLKPTSGRLKNIRGYTFMNASFLDKLARLKDHILTQGCPALIADETYEGKPAIKLHIKHKEHKDPVTHEDLWFGKDDYLIIKNIKHENDIKVTDTSWNYFELNVLLEDSLFEQ